MKYLLISLCILFVSFSGFNQKTDSVTVNFEFNSSEVTGKNKQIINDLKSQLAQSGVEVVSISAYCDTVGSIQYNRVLAKKRFQEVALLLSLEVENINQFLIGEEYVFTPLTKNLPTSEFRKVVVHYRSEEIIEVINEPQKTEVKELTDEFIAFLNDSTKTEAMIEVSILFVPGKPFYLLESEPQLWALFDFLKYNMNISAVIRGHVCCSDDYPLSLKRAETVYDFVTERGISPKRLSYYGVSNTIPAVSPEITDEDMKRNRRVIVIFKKGK